MNRSIKQLELQDGDQNIPCVSLILPYEMKMKNKASLLCLLSAAETSKMEIYQKLLQKKILPLQRFSICGCQVKKNL